VVVEVGVAGMAEAAARVGVVSRGDGPAYADAESRAMGVSSTTRLKGSLQRFLGALINRGASAALKVVDRFSGKLEEVTAGGGVVAGVAGGGVKALVAGKNPVWGAVKGAVGGLSTKTKVLIVLVVVLGLLLGPVVLVLVLLALLVLAIVLAVRSSAPT
jgi:hypothetical protein